MAKRISELWMDRVTIGSTLYPPAKRTHGAISINIGKMKIVRIKMGQAEGWVNELVVKQVPSGSGGGTSIGFTVELLESKIPHYMASDVNQERAYNATPSATIELFRVLDDKRVAAAGGSVIVQSLDYGFAFFNNDGESQTEAEKYLYLCIIPNNALDVTKWEASLTYLRDIG